MMNGVKQAIVCMTLAVQTLYALPSFVTDPPYDEQYYYEFGEADGSNASQAFKRAEERAWEKIKEQIELKIESMQIDYEAHTGKRAESFFTELRHVTSDVMVQTQRIKNV